MLRHLKFLFPAIGNEVRRENLMWVQCHIIEKYLYMTAADGTIIKTVKTYYGDDLYDSIDSVFYINRSAVESECFPGLKSL